MTLWQGGLLQCHLTIPSPHPILRDCRAAGPALYGQCSRGREHLATDWAVPFKRNSWVQGHMDLTVCLAVPLKKNCPAGGKMPSMATHHRGKWGVCVGKPPLNLFWGLKPPSPPCHAWVCLCLSFHIHRVGRAVPVMLCSVQIRGKCNT